MKIFVSFMVCFCVALLGGCGQIELLRTKELRNLEKEVADLKVETAKLQVAMGSGFSEQLTNVKEQEQALNRMKADIQALITRLEQQLSTLEGRMEESTHRLQTIAEKTDRIDSKEFILKGGYAAAPSSAVPESGAVTAASSVQNGAPRVVVQEKTDIEKLYKMAYEDFHSRKYDLARQGFEELLKNYPGNDLSDNAQYWIAECYLAKGEYAKAITEYQKVADLYPLGNKAPAALFKKGIAKEKLNDRAGMEEAWKTLIEKYPVSNESQLAKDRMDN